MSFTEQVSTALVVIATRGLPVTLLISTLSFLLGLCLGSLLAFLQILGGNIAERISGLIVTILRGIPPVLLLFIIFYGFPALGLRLDRNSAAILGLGLISSAYQSQVLRSSAQSISARQLEAALSIGLSKWGAFAWVIFPQAIRLSVPGLINEFTIIFKDTSIAYSIGVVEMFTQATQIAQARFEYTAPLTAVALLYLAICFSISQLINVLYKKLRELGYGY